MATRWKDIWQNLELVFNNFKINAFSVTFISSKSQIGIPRMILATVIMPLMVKTVDKEDGVSSFWQVHSTSRKTQYDSPQLS